MSNLTKLSTKAPQPFFNKLVAPNFEALRVATKEKSGLDFLAKCGDVFRAATLKSSKDGVAYRSNHKTGRAFDYDQTSPAIVIVLEPRNGKTFFRTYLKCAKQDGSLGTKVVVKDRRGFTFSGYAIDFTELAKQHGFERIPAWNGWQRSYNRQEFWHYQKMDGLTWDEAMRQLKDNTPVEHQPPTHHEDKIYGFGDRGLEVQKIQKRLAELKLLPLTECDGIFGQVTRKAVTAFQKKHGLSADGLVGKDTRSALFK